MALTMVHLLAADRWAEGHPEYRESPAFYYGVISPDAIHIRYGGDKSRKDELHLHNWRKPHPDEVLAYWRENGDPFDIGYGVHVLTDGQWVQRYLRMLPGLMLPTGRLNVDVYYNDTFVTDFLLYRHSKRLEELLQMIGRAPTPESHPCLTADEFEKWRERILASYRGECPYHGEPRFIDEEYVHGFVEDCIPLIEETFDRFREEKTAAIFH